jgi:hypothetical protein
MYAGEYHADGNDYYPAQDEQDPAAEAMRQLSEQRERIARFEQGN